MRNKLISVYNSRRKELFKETRNKRYNKKKEKISLVKLKYNSINNFYLSF